MGIIAYSLPSIVARTLQSPQPTNPITTDDLTHNYAANSPAPEAPTSMDDSERTKRHQCLQQNSQQQQQPQERQKQQHQQQQMPMEQEILGGFKLTDETVNAFLDLARKCCPKYSGLIAPAVLQCSGQAVKTGIPRTNQSIIQIHFVGDHWMASAY